MVYRRATLADTLHIVDIRRQLIAEDNPVHVGDISDELYSYFYESLTNGQFIAWLAEVDDTIVGTCGVCFPQFIPTVRCPTGRQAWITNVYICKEHRRQHLATKLLNLVIEDVKALGHTIIRVNTSIDGKAFYQNYGFLNADRFMFYKLDS